MSIYNGFSTVSSGSQKKFVLTDGDLIKQDLMNALMTPQGSRVMQPNFGCIAWNMLFESLSTSTAETIAENISGIVAADPRVNLLSIDVSQSVPNTIIVTLLLQYVSTNQTEQLIVNFGNETALDF